jgi:predicted Zn-dependent protease
MREPSSDDLQAVVQRARKRGARAAEVLWIGELGQRRDSAPGKVAASTPIASDELRVRVWTDTGEGRAKGPIAAIGAIVDRAFAAVAPAGPDDGPVAKLQPLTAGLATEDRRFDQLTDADRLDVLAEAEAAARLADPRFAATGFGYEERRTRRLFASSVGTRAQDRATSFRAWASGTATPANTAIRLESEVLGRSFSSVASLPFGVELARRAQALLAPPMLLPRGPVRVLLGSPQAAALLDRLARLCVPERIDASFLPGVVLDPRIHLVDDPTVTGGLRTRAFDDRGVPPIPLTLIREGRAHATLLDARSAAARDVRPSGHEVGDRLEPSNLLFRHGTRSVHVILGELGGTTFAPDDLLGFRGLDPATGQFAATVHGTVYEGARPLGPALGVRLSGFLGDILARVLEISGETDRIGHVDAPAMVLDGFSVG